ncbi:GNAT family N-acetyltransferase [Clostridium ganghwense]|uniref:GNAT family N-acetyltransferase n=1 Tax=Clostridium ganghwense TaxID=312089 RepID=A0ABT4CQB0_9CLOT|nr:GNAT family N-acetyltransferase [Clostridium ganghwense]MCY6370184.1 GNAT family N-acetyltransferase [Clostridium ganghwense]
MAKIHTINNLNSTTKEISKEKEDLASQIARLVNENMAHSNNNTYSEDEMKRLSHNKTAESMLDLINRSYLIYLTNEQDEIVGCGMVVRQDNRYFAKTLHIRSDYRGLGYAQQICDLREKFLRTIGEKEIYIESLKYPKTIEFHKKRGFVEIPFYRELKYTLLMKKNL